MEEELEVCPCEVITAKTSPSCSSKKNQELTAAVFPSYNVIYMGQNPTAR